MTVELVLSLLAAALAMAGFYLRFVRHRADEEERRLRAAERAARAEFEITLRTVGADDDGILWTRPNTATQISRLGIGVKNVGEKAAGETIVNVIVPNSLEYARWCGPTGEEREEGKLTAQPGELLPDAKGNGTIGSQFGSSTWPSVRLRPHYEKFVQFPVELPSLESGLRQAVVPVRVRIQADELPDDTPEYVIDHVVRVVREG